MILILSQEGVEPTTDAVMDWIRHLGGDCVRVNGADLAGGVGLEMGVDEGGPLARLNVAGREVTSRQVRVVWLWRWQLRALSAARPQPGAEPLAEKINAHLKGETNAVTGAFFSFFRHARWLTSPDEAALGKVKALQAASEAGLEVPATLITNRKAELERFRARHASVITKSIGDAAILPVGERWYAMYTAEPTDEVMAELPETIFPSLVQARVEKAFEIRAFYLDGRVWSMAIFSQGNRRTSVDLRQGDGKNPGRRVPYRLPEPVESAVRRFMESLGLSSGSLDLVRTPDGRHVFLEVNPAGQIGMMSVPCNYHLPRRVAEYLIAEDAHVRA